MIERMAMAFDFIKRFGRLVPLIPLLFFIMSLGTSADGKSNETRIKAPYNAVVTACRGLVMRKGPDRSSERVGNVPYESVIVVRERGREETIDGITAPWCRIDNNGESVWIFGGFIDAENEVEGKPVQLYGIVHGMNRVIYEYAAVGSKSVCSVWHDERVSILSGKGTPASRWYRIQKKDKRTGWISAEDLSVFDKPFESDAYYRRAVEKHIRAYAGGPNRLRSFSIEYLKGRGVYLGRMTIIEDEYMALSPMYVYRVDGKDLKVLVKAISSMEIFFCRQYIFTVSENTSIDIYDTNQVIEDNVDPLAEGSEKRGDSLYRKVSSVHGRRIEEENGLKMFDAEFIRFNTHTLRLLAYLKSDPLRPAYRYAFRDGVFVKVEGDGAAPDSPVYGNDAYENLMIAIESDDPDGVTSALDRGANVNMQDEFQETPLLVAIGNRNERIAAILLKRGVNIEAADRYGSTPLIVSVLNRHGNMAALLVSNGANVNKASPNGVTPLMYAVMHGELKMAQFLAGKGASVNAKTDENQTALMYAVQHCDEEMVRYLLSRGAEVNVTNKYGLSIMKSARCGNNGKIVELLKKAGAR